MRKIFLCALCLFMTGCFLGCGNCIMVDDGGYGNYVHPKFETNYTVEEHIERIKAETEEVFSNEIENGVLVNYTVDIVHAFYDDDPEYFLVELEYAYEWRGKTDNGEPYGLKYTTKYRNLIGYISNDSYRVGGPIPGIFKDGRSAYTLSGYKTAKKYYGALVFGVEKDGEILQIYEGQGIAEFGNPKYLTQKIVPKSSYKKLMKNNNKTVSHSYLKELEQEKERFNKNYIREY